MWVAKCTDGRDLTYEESTGAFAIGGTPVSFMLIVPLFLGWVLPPPASWLPEQIAGIAESRRQEALSNLRVRAMELESARSR